MYRSLPMNIILTIVTCGIYGLYWFVVLTDDVNELSGKRNDTSGIVALFLTIITCGLYGIYWAYKLGEKMSFIKTMYYGRQSSDAVLYIICFLIGLPIIVYALAQNDINNIIDGNNGYYGGYGANSNNKSTVNDNIYVSNDNNNVEDYGDE